MRSFTAFVNEIIHSIVKEWPGEVMVVNGRQETLNARVSLSKAMAW